MTWTLVQHSASVATSSSGSIAGTLPGASTAGNLLVACVSSTAAAVQFTAPTGWVQGPQISNGSLSRTEIWYYTANPGGITSATFTSGTSFVRAALAEFSTNVAGTITVATATGTNGSTASTTCTVSGTATAGSLMVCAFLEHMGSSASVTWTDPSGFTLLNNISTSNPNPTYAAYQLAAAGGSYTVTGTSNTISGNTGWTGCVIAFTASTQTVAVGATTYAPVSEPQIPPEQSDANFIAVTGRPIQVSKIYYQLSEFPFGGGGGVNLTAKDISGRIARGVKCLLCVKPAFNPPTTADFNNLSKLLAGYKAAGLNAEVAYFQEPIGPNGPTPAQYNTAVQFYKAAITPYYPLVATMNYGGIGHYPNGFTDYWNACPPGTFAKGYLDFYAQEWLGGALIDPAAACCDAQGVPFGISEWGCAPGDTQGQTQQACINFMNYVACSPSSFMQQRQANGQPIADLIWYNNGPTGTLVNWINTASDFRVPLYQAAFDALTTSASGTVSISATLTAITTPAAAITGGAVPSPVTNPGAPGPNGFPVLIGEIGVVPTSPVPAPGTFLLGDPTYGLLNLDVLGAATQWADISSFVKSFTAARTSTRQNAPVISYDPGSLSAVLDNTDARFDPDNLNGPYVGAGVTELHPMTPVQVRAVWQGTTYPLFAGFADSWITPDVNYGPNTSETNLSATDGFKVLSGFQLAAAQAAAQAAGAHEFPAGPGENTGARVTRLLNIAGWSNDDRVIDTGNSQLQGTSLNGPDALTELQLSVDTELGELYVNGAGKVVFRRRHGVMEDPRSSVAQAVFGDQSGTGALLNSNPGFEGPGGSTAGWNAQNAATLTVVGTAFYSGAFAGAFSGNGSTSNPSIITAPHAAVTPGQYVTFSAWLQAVNNVPWQTNLIIRFFDSGGTHLTAFDATTTVQTASVWQQVTAGTFVPTGAATVAGAIQMAGTPPSPIPETLVDEAYLSVSPELPYTGLGRSDDDTQLCNDAQITAAGSANLQEAQDAASIAKFLYPRSYQRSDLLLESDTEALEWGQFIVYLSKGAEDRFDTITLSPLRDPRLWPQALGREIGDMIAVIRRPPNMAPITKQLIIRGITHTVAVSPASWQTQWILQDASRYSFLTLGDPLQGALDSNALAY